jgi:hypothetical protein
MDRASASREVSATATARLGESDVSASVRSPCGRAGHACHMRTCAPPPDPLGRDVRRR